ncbi:MAG: potassium transporter Kup [Rhodocyclales bacterium]|nr:potassium transporter Kup [Rhodocyclales bacterium]
MRADPGALAAGAAPPSESSHRSSTAALTLAALGVVYGDIGTSPLYAIKEVFGNAHHPVPIAPDNVLGILSLVFWSLVVVVSVKYVAIVLRADNKGEGGIMALMALALAKEGEGTRTRAAALLFGLFGAALFYGDGVLTPAISVLSAVEGLEVATPALKPYVLPVTIGVLVVLFFFQRHGTAKIGGFFGPITCLWFLALATLGIREISQRPEVLMAVWPGYGLRFLAEHAVLGFFALGAVFLAVTGAEALYADMGHFGRRPIRLAWFGLVLPALLLNYFGQGALLLGRPEAIANPFYLLAPEWALYPLVALATAATVIASQAVISGAYSITQQAMQLGYSPRMDIQHTSTSEIGQIYMPAINWTLLAAVIALVLSFQSSTALAGAYGIAVVGTMIITTLFAYLVARHIWRWGQAKSLAVFGLLLLVDVSFFAANAVKIPDGGWFPLVFGAAVFMLLTTWQRGRELLLDRTRADAIDLKTFIASLAYAPPPQVPGTAVFMTSNPNGVPQALLHNLMHNKVLHERIVLLTVVVHDVPYVPEIDRVEVHRIDGPFWQLLVQYGFKDEPDIPRALELCAEIGLRFEMMETSFFLGRETLIPRLRSAMPYWREKLFVALFRNAGSATAFFKIPSNRVVELGTQIEL